MTRFAEVTVELKNWLNERHKGVGITRLSKLAMLATRNGSRLYPVISNPKASSPTPQNPYGSIGLTNQELLELLYYDGMIGGMALASGDQANFLECVWGCIKLQVAAEWQVIDKKIATSSAQNFVPH